MIRIPVASLDDLQPGTFWSAEVHNRHNACLLLCVADHMRSHQKIAVYQVQGGKDAGDYKATPLLEFVTKFRRIEKPAPLPVESASATVADMTEKGKGF